MVPEPDILALLQVTAARAADCQQARGRSIQGLPPLPDGAPSPRVIVGTSFVEHFRPGATLLECLAFGLPLRRGESRATPLRLLLALTKMGSKRYPAKIEFLTEIAEEFALVRYR